MTEFQHRIDMVLHALNKAEVRATYSAVGEYVGLQARSVSQFLGAPRPEASWVVARSSGLPTDYRHHDWHPKLTANPHVIDAGSELERLLESQAPRTIAQGVSRDARQIAGIDLAWNTERNASGLALGRLNPGGLRIESVRGDIVGLDILKQALDMQENLIGVAVDAPLVINNKAGSRPCEKALSIAYGARWAGCHPSNLTRFPEAGSVTLSHWLLQKGFDHLGRGGKWQIEVYPHPAIIELFSLGRRLLYKKGSVQQRRVGQEKLTNLLRSLAQNVQLPLLFDDHMVACMIPGHALAIPAGNLKENEDMLDAIVCCYIGALFDLGITRQIFGSRASGYIVVP